MSNDNERFQGFSSDNFETPNSEENVNLYTGNGETDLDESINLNSFLQPQTVKKKVKGERVIKIPFADKLKIKKEIKMKEDTYAKLKRIGRVALTLILIGIITCGIGIGTVVGWLASEESKGTFDMVQYDLEGSLNFTTTIYVKNDSGDYVEYDRIHGTNNRIWVDGEDIPDMLKNAYVAIEDKRFNSHTGVDWKRTVYAFANSFLNLSSRQGGSTITQQLVKNITSDNDISAMRKVREIMRARYLEDNYSKESILEWYLNTISMGTGIYGVEVAANYYFGKSVGELTIAECASLASITKEPEAYRPDLEANHDYHMQRRNLVLSEMLSQKHITKEEYEEALNTKLEVVADQDALNVQAEATSYFVDTLIDDVVDMLVTKKGYDKDVAEQEVYNGGYKIYSTLNPKVQKALDDVYNDKSFFAAPVSATNNKTTPNSSMTVMDYEGHIVGIVGGKGKKKEARSLNRATSSPRQIGSSMKPIGVYSLAIEYNELTYSSMVDDRQMSWSDPSIKGGRWPNNYDFSYTGKTTVEYAIYHSVNCTPVHILRNIIGNGSDNYTEANNGIEISYDFLTSKLGLKHLTDDDKNFSSLCLGGCAYGATSEELAAAYAVFGNLGNYYKPTTYTVIYDQFDNVVDDTTKDKPIMAISEDTATVMNHLLRQVIKKGTGKGVKVGKFDVFAKTGTTTDSQDLWFAGGTPYYVGACWYGFDNPQKYSPNGMSGYFPNGASVSGAALRIWNEVMSRAHEGLEEKEFVDSEYAEELKYCTSTGMIAKAGCTKTAKGWYRSDNIPEPCSKHGDKKANKKDKEDKEDKEKDDKKDNASSTDATTSSKKEETSSASSTTSSKPESTESATTSTTTEETSSTTSE